MNSFKIQNFSLVIDTVANIGTIKNYFFTSPIINNIMSIWGSNNSEMRRDMPILMADLKMDIIFKLKIVINFQDIIYLSNSLQIIVCV